MASASGLALIAAFGAPAHAQSSPPPYSVRVGVPVEETKPEPAYTVRVAKPVNDDVKPVSTGDGSVRVTRQQQMDASRESFEVRQSLAEMSRKGDVIGVALATTQEQERTPNNTAAIYYDRIEKYMGARGQSIQTNDLMVNNDYHQNRVYFAVRGEVTSLPLSELNASVLDDVLRKQNPQLAAAGPEASK